ncbi:MAG: alpha/beta hydrolase [Methanomicrobium sp.]|nr:alpha/beta hydrolase [Methanomicrobium sp.]
MIKQNFYIENIPSVLWGKPEKKLIIAVHGNMSCKDDVPIEILAKEAALKGYQVLSFDLPQHGDRKNSDYPCSAQNCIRDIFAVANYAQTISESISLFACSMGVYFSIISLRNFPLERCLFLSPVFDMERLIKTMMTEAGIGEERLRDEGEIKTNTGEIFSWNYYSHVQSHPAGRWDRPSFILYGSKDTLVQKDEILDFANRNHSRLDVMNGGEHYFHTKEQLKYLRLWLENNISNP